MNITKLSTFSALTILGIALAGCSGKSRTSGGYPEPSRTASSELRAVGSCADLATQLRIATLRQMNQRIDRNLQLALDGQFPGYYEEGPLADAGASLGSAPPGTGGGSSGGPADDSGQHASHASSTNNQVRGVDEPDFVKNDRKYIYLVSGRSLHIVDAFPPDKAHEVAKIRLAERPKSIFVQGNRLLVYSSTPPEAYYPSEPTPGGYGDSDGNYGVMGDGSSTRVDIYDISNKAAPKIERVLKISGSFVSARMVGDTVHTVVYDMGATPQLNLRYYPDWPADPHSLSEQEIRNEFEKLRAENARIINQTDFLKNLPDVDSIDYVNGTPHEHDDLLAQCNGFYVSSISDGQGFLSVLSWDIDDDNSFGNSTIFSTPGVVYASGESLYVALPHLAQPGGAWYQGMEDIDEVTAVHKFALTDSPPSSKYEASGLVKGRVLNQFSMDEYKGNLRIATTTGYLPNPDASNHVMVLGRKGRKLKVLGAVHDIGRGEDIRSVRFDGNLGYVVTFKKTDPLFVLDLSSPTAPRVLGELKIPGYSTYMHKMDDKHLLTIGFDADDQGSFAWFQGIMLQIFDVSNPVAPKLVHKEVIGTRGSNSDATANHLAFNYYPRLNMLAFPMTVCEGSSGGGNYGTKMTFTGLMVYDTTVEKGFKLHGKIPFASPNDNAPYSESCMTWWTNPNTVVKRSIFMDNYVYAITANRMKVDALDSLGTDIADIQFTD